MHSWDGPNAWRFEMRVPNYKKYKIDGIKQLEFVRSELAKKGLTDPWIRNEVWRYPDWYEHPTRSIRRIFTIGVKPALILVTLTIIGQEMYWKKHGRPKYIHTLYDYLYHHHEFPDNRRKE